jgi:predicted RecB family nuclease
MSMRISKTKFIAGCQCLKRLYLEVHEPKLAAEPDGAVEAIIEQGRDVGMLARQLFPGGIEVRSDDDGGLDQAIRTTRELIVNPDVKAIFEGVFEHGNVLVRVDVLHRRKDGRWKMIEIKSTTDLKDHHLEDVAIQYRVVSRSGLDVASASLAHVNRNYVYPGGEIDPREFFRIRNVTRRVESLQHKLTLQLRSEFLILAQPTPPNVKVGAHCTAPVTCEFVDHCNPPLPQDHIGFLPRIHASTLEALEAIGVESIRDIPRDFELSDIQRRAATCVQTGEPWFSPELREVLDGLTYPLYFADFETLNRAIPPFAGMRAYDHLPFEWSVHVQRQPGAEPEHYEFLATDANDPRREFISSLCAALGEGGRIVVYHQPFEDARLSELAAWMPEFAERIKKIQRRLWDLLPVIRDHVYHPVFGGSYSLKSVLPALVPEMTYNGMEVADGQDAGLAWESLIQSGMDQVERDKMKKPLLDYCRQDTLALVRVLDKLNLLNSGAYENPIPASLRQMR